jgi:hypothetical protein
MLSAIAPSRSALARSLSLADEHLDLAAVAEVRPFREALGEHGV